MGLATAAAAHFRRLARRHRDAEARRGAAQVDARTAELLEGVLGRLGRAEAALEATKVRRGRSVAFKRYRIS